MAIRRWAGFAALALGLVSAGCSSRRGPVTPAYPSDPDPCSAYCLVWVPPVYRDVPHVVACRPAGSKCVTVPVKQIVFEECVKPGCYTPKRTPCRCRTEEAIVQATPGCEAWQKVDSCGDENCYQHVKVPPTYKLCEKTITEGGVAYCAFKPPEYDVVARTCTTCEQKEVYCPGEYRVVNEKECFQNGRYEWRRRPAGATPCAPCAPCPPRAPSTCRPGFGVAPSAD